MRFKKKKILEIEQCLSFILSFFVHQLNNWLRASMSRCMLGFELSGKVMSPDCWNAADVPVGHDKVLV